MSSARDGCLRLELIEYPHRERITDPTAAEKVQVDMPCVAAPFKFIIIPIWFVTAEDRGHDARWWTYHF